jgi:hypothetical protein
MQGASNIVIASVSEAIHLAAYRRIERMDCFVASLLAMTPRYSLAISPRDPREFCRKHLRLLKIEGAGKAGCPKHPRPVCIGRKHTVVTTGTPETSGLPCAMVLTVSSVISLVTGLSCHHRQREIPPT